MHSIGRAQPEQVGLKGVARPRQSTRKEKEEDVRSSFHSLITMVLKVGGGM
jgi:hypothetical protein